jgi:hypothetical protein
MMVVLHALDRACLGKDVQFVRRVRSCGIAQLATKPDKFGRSSCDRSNRAVTEFPILGGLSMFSNSGRLGEHSKCRNDPAAIANARLLPMLLDGD